MKELTQHHYINLFHVLAVAPLLGYVGYMGPATHPTVFKILLVVAVIVAIFHIYRFSTR